MSEAGTYLPLKPTDGYQGDALFTILDAIVDQFDSHDHDGTDSAKIAISGLTEASATLAAAGWTATGSVGLYRQSVTITGGKNFNQTQFSVQDTDNNFPIYT